VCWLIFNPSFSYALPRLILYPCSYSNATIAIQLISSIIFESIPNGIKVIIKFKVFKALLFFEVEMMLIIGQVGLNLIFDEIYFAKFSAALLTDFLFALTTIL